jgi:hypothetical protein
LNAPRCDLAHYNECADTLQQHGADCAQAGGGAPAEVRRCLDFFFGGDNATEYCCPCVLFYAQKYGLPTLGPACAGAGPAPPPPPPPWGACTAMAGRWRNVAPGAGQGDVTTIEQGPGACNWLGVNTIQDWYRALGVWVDRWDLLVTFEQYDRSNVTYSGHLDGCNPEVCSSGSTITFASPGGDSNRWQKI